MDEDDDKKKKKKKKLNKVDLNVKSFDQGDSKTQQRKEFRNFLEYVYNEYLRKRLHRIGRYFDHPKMYHYWEYEWRGLKRALHVIAYINAYCDDVDDIYRTFRIERLRRAVNEIESGVQWNNRLANEIGLLEALDQYYAEIVSGIDISDFPSQEVDILSEFGFESPSTDLQGIIYLLKMRQREKQKLQKEKSCVSSELKRTVEILSSVQEEFIEKDEKSNETSEPPKKSRRWFKGLGKIGQGTAMSIADICLATDLLKFQVSTETKTWGVLVSTTAGIGMILDGIGELRGE